MLTNASFRKNFGGRFSDIVYEDRDLRAVLRLGAATAVAGQWWSLTAVDTTGAPAALSRARRCHTGVRIQSVPPCRHQPDVTVTLEVTTVHRSLK